MLRLFVYVATSDSPNWCSALRQSIARLSQQQASCLVPAAPLSLAYPMLMGGTMPLNIQNRPRRAVEAPWYCYLSCWCCAATCLCSGSPTYSTAQATNALLSVIHGLDAAFQSCAWVRAHSLRSNLPRVACVRCWICMSLDGQMFPRNGHM